MKIKNKNQNNTKPLSRMNKIVPTYFRTNILDLISLYYLRNINGVILKKTTCQRKSILKS